MRLLKCLQFLLDRLHKELLPKLGGGDPWAPRDNLLLRGEEADACDAAVPQVRQARAGSSGVRGRGRGCSAEQRRVRIALRSVLAWQRHGFRRTWGVGARGA